MATSSKRTAAAGRDEQRVCVAPLSTFAAYASSIGASAIETFVSAGVPAAVLSDPWGRIPVGSFLGAIAALAKRLGEPTLGLRAGQHVDVSFYGSQAYFSGCPDVRSTIIEAFSSVREAGHLVAPFSVERGSVFRAIFGGIPPSVPGSAQYATFATAITLGVIRVHANERIAATSVHLVQQAPPDLSEYERYFGCSVGFGADTASLEVPAAALDRPNVFANPGLAAILRGQMQDELRTRAPRDVLTARVRTLLRERLRATDPIALPEIARSLALAPRTLQKHLSQAGTHFRLLLDEARSERARFLLEDAALPLEEVAAGLGFDDLSSLHRASRRWFGKTPQRARRELLEASARGSSAVLIAPSKIGARR